MIVYKKQPKSRSTILVRTQHLRYLALLLVVASLAYLGPQIFNSMGELFSKWGHTANHTEISKYRYIRSLARPLVNFPATLWHHFNTNPQTPHLYIDVKHSAFQKIESKRKEALQRGLLSTAKGDYVAAKMRFNETQIKAKIRLKGDYLDHIAHPSKWSFRIKLDDDAAFLGMRVFSIQHPKIRNYHHEAVLMDFLRDEGIIAPRYSFIKASINGNPLGYMALEEHFSKEILESNHRREGVILHFSETTAFEAKQQGLTTPNVYNWINAPIKVFREKRVLSSEKLKREYYYGRALLRSFISEKLPASKVFNTEQISRFIAILELWDNSHGFAWNNIRFYLNPITLLLEPIAYDLLPLTTGSSSGKIINSTDGLFAKIVSDPQVSNTVLSYLKSYTKRMIHGEIEKQLKARNLNYTRTLITEFPLVYPVKFDQKYHRALQLKDVNAKNFLTARRFKEPEPPLPALANLYRTPNGELLVQNLLPEPITIHKVFSNTQLINKAPIFIEGRPGNRPGNLVNTNLKVAESTVAEVGLRGSEHRKLIEVTEQASITAKALSSNIQLRDLLKEFPFLERNNQRKSLRIKQGKWKVQKHLELPHGYSLYVEAGTHLKFKENIGISLKGGALLAEGTQKRGILLSGAPNWAGVSVIQSPAPSTLKHVTLEHMQGIRTHQPNLDAGITFYESNVTMQNVTVKNTSAEDAVNIIRSKLDIDGLRILHSSSDGIDIDFGNGVIQNSFFKHIGGDAIDLSGAKLNLKNIDVYWAKDKGISAGEASTVEAKNIRVFYSGTGLVSKDLSIMSATDVTVLEPKTSGIMVYQKKKEYGPGTFNGTRVEVIDTKIPYIAQEGNTLTVNGRRLKTTKFDTKKLYQLETMKK